MSGFLRREPGSDLTQETFEQLLIFLSPDRERAGRRYEEVRLRLVKIFACRGCLIPEELADETINRVARKVGEIGKTYVGDPALYFCGVARKVFLESVRKRPERRPLPKAESSVDKELELECLDQCMQTLTPKNRRLILEYYQGERGDKIKHRKELAHQWGVGPNALRIRAHRIRHNLHECVVECFKRNEIG
jgi:DNA-directed RNA polymerase specialized sigma24 family protein